MHDVLKESLSISSSLRNTTQIAYKHYQDSAIRRRGREKLVSLGFGDE